MVSATRSSALSAGTFDDEDAGAAGVVFDTLFKSPQPVKLTIMTMKISRKRCAIMGATPSAVQ
jgi:hypothetical protein